MAHSSRSIHDALYQTLIVGLRASREQSGLRQEDVADALGMTQSMYSKIERAERRVDLLEFVLIANILSTEPSRLLKQILGDTEIHPRRRSRAKRKR